MVHAAAMASIGHHVVAVDISIEKIASLNKGIAPIYEPGLDALLADGLNSGRLRFVNDIKAVESCDIHFLAVGTPQKTAELSADLSYLHGAVGELLPYLRAGTLVVGKSTVPVGTAKDLEIHINGRGAALLWNPEFLREGWAVSDTLNPDRIVVGTSDRSGAAGHIKNLRSLYSSASPQTPFLVTNFATAELVKGAANAFLATKISFINAMAEIADASGADVTELADALGHDERIGRRFLGAGIGFGGGCLPKDIRAFAARAEELGRGDAVRFLHEVDGINVRRREKAVALIETALLGEVSGRRITILGAAFKPGSDDIRDSPALDAALRLHELGAKVVVTDPRALANAQLANPHLSYEHDPEHALKGADAVLLATEWDEYRDPKLAQTAASLVHQMIVVDGRNCLNAQAWRDQGWRYIGMGRP